MQVLCAALLVRPDREGFEDRQRSRDGRPARKARQGVDTVPAIHRRERGLLDRAVAAKILHREEATARAHAVDDRVSELAFVQDARSVASDGLERPREVGLHELVRRLGTDRRPKRRPRRPEEDVLRVTGPVQALVIHGQREADVPIDLEALARDADRRLHDALARQPSVALEREAQRGRLPRHADRERPLDVRVVLHRGPGVHARARVATLKLEHVRTRGPRRRGAALDARDRPVGPADHEPGDPSEPAGERLDHVHHERGGDGGVHRIAAVAHDLDPGFGGEMVLGGHHAVRRDGLRLGVQPFAPHRGHARRGYPR